MRLGSLVSDSMHLNLEASPMVPLEQKILGERMGERMEEKLHQQTRELHERIHFHLQCHWLYLRRYDFLVSVLLLFEVNIHCISRLQVFHILDYVLAQIQLPFLQP